MYPEHNSDASPWAEFEFEAHVLAGYWRRVVCREDGVYDGYDEGNLFQDCGCRAFHKKDSRIDVRDLSMNHGRVVLTE